MSYYTADNPPRGIWYEAARHRWRVRLYRRNRPVFTTYARSFSEALSLWHEAKDQQREIRRAQCAPIGHSLADRFEAMARKLL